MAALLRTAEQLTPRYRNDVCFLFLDGGSDNMRGAKGFRKRYPSAKEKPVLCLDCVGSGDELLILPGKGARWNGELLDAINSSFENSGAQDLLRQGGRSRAFPRRPARLQAGRRGLRGAPRPRLRAFHLPDGEG